MAKYIFLFFLFIPYLQWEVMAQTPPPPTVEADKVDLRTAQFRWDYPIDEPVNEFNVKCGPTKGGPYPLVANLPNALARSFPARGVISIEGQYACVVTAVRSGNESVPSNEVFFSATISTLPPLNLRLEKETK